MSCTRPGRLLGPLIIVAPAAPLTRLRDTSTTMAEITDILGQWVSVNEIKKIGYEGASLGSYLLLLHTCPFILSLTYQCLLVRLLRVSCMLSN